MKAGSISVERVAQPARLAVAPSAEHPTMAARRLSPETLWPARKPFDFMVIPEATHSARRKSISRKTPIHLHKAARADIPWTHARDCVLRDYCSFVLGLPDGNGASKVV
jgi:hypothetical protein